MGIVAQGKNLSEELVWLLSHGLWIAEAAIDYLVERV